MRFGIILFNRFRSALYPILYYLIFRVFLLSFSRLRIRVTHGPAVCRRRRVRGIARRISIVVFTVFFFNNILSRGPVVTAHHRATRRPRLYATRSLLRSPLLPLPWHSSRHRENVIFLFFTPTHLVRRGKKK